MSEHVLSRPCEGEIKCYFVKIIGDYYRYISEHSSGFLLDEVKSKALDSYKVAWEIQLPSCNTVKLGLALNFSVFLHEVMHNY